MELQLQFGYGMMDHSRVLISSWGGGTVIMSPRDLSPTQVERLAEDISEIPNGNALFDPQFYLPHADHQRLTSHKYWPSKYQTTGFWSGPDIAQLIAKLSDLNRSLGTDSFILPGLYADRVDDDWIARQSLVISEARSSSDQQLFATVALSADVVRSDNAIDDVLAAADGWDIDGAYLVLEHPSGDYLVTDPAWLANALDLVAGLRIKGIRVIVGYCNHQMLIMACAGANSIASGTWMNVRSFPPNKFRTQYDEEIKQRAIWYYCSKALSEYKIPFLDIAQKTRILHLMKPDPRLGSSFADVLFSGIQPSALKWTEQSAFRHYLQTLHSQTRLASKATFDETVASYEKLLDDAEAVATELRKNNVKGQLREFRECFDANRAALAALKEVRGPMLRRRWASMT